MRAQLAERGVKLISGTLDESPSAYKDIGAVMAAQADLVDCLARFDPLIVKMAGDEDGRPAAARRRKAGARPRP